jgi:hypothetical protein
MVQAWSEWQKSFQPKVSRQQSDAWRDLAIQDADNGRAGPLTMRDGSK